LTPEPDPPDPAGPDRPDPAGPDRPDPAGPDRPDPASPGNRDQGEPGERDPGLARERTSLAWTRTALSFAAVGGVMLKREVIPGLIVLAVAPAIWQLGRLREHFPRRLELITATVVAVALVALVVALTY
jgi:uncharacterized membrane protein YidH (DUF202 family)